MKKLWLILGLMVLTFSAFAAPAVLADGPSEARIGRTELRFMQGMIDHHQMALDMANDCLAKAIAESVRNFLRRCAIGIFETDTEVISGCSIDVKLGGLEDSRERLSNTSRGSFKRLVST